MHEEEAGLLKRLNTLTNRLAILEGVATAPLRHKGYIKTLVTCAVIVALMTTVAALVAINSLTEVTRTTSSIHSLLQTWDREELGYETKE